MLEMLQRMEERSGKTPEALEKLPRLNEVEGFYQSAFYFCSPSRHSGMGIGAIPLSEYISYYDIFGAPHDLPLFTEIMRGIDARYVKQARAKKN